MYVRSYVDITMNSVSLLMKMHQIVLIATCTYYCVSNTIGQLCIAFTCTARLSLLWIIILLENDEYFSNAELQINE